MEPLIFKIETQADDSGVRQYDKSLGGLDVSSKKASGALKNFVKSLSEAKDGTDIASSALGAFGQVLGSSIAGTAIIIAGKTLIDSFNKINQAVKESEKAVAEAFAGMDRAGKALSFAEATAQAKGFESVAETIRKKIKEINDSPLDSIIDSITQSTAVMDIQALLVENQAKEIKRLGAESELVHLQKMQGLDAENKALELNSRALAKELDGISAIDESETALAVTRKYQLQADEIRAKFADDRNKTEVENASTRQKEIDAQIKKEQELATVQQKRFNDLYDAEVRAQEETQKRVDANLKAEQDLSDKRQSLQQDLGTAKAQQKMQSGGAAPETAANMSGGSASRGAGQRETSYEIGLRNAIARAEQQGRTRAADAEIERKIAEIKAERKAVGDTRFTGKGDAMNRMQEEALKAADAQGAASSGTEQMAQSVADAQQAISDFAQTTQAASTASESFSTGLSNLGTGFDSAMNNANNFADSITQNGGSMVEDFLKAGDQSTDLGKDFDKAGEAVDDFAKKLKKSEGGGGGTEGGKKRGEPQGSLGSIEKLLRENFNELKAYAHAT